jgi:hypothetical protein
MHDCRKNPLKGRRTVSQSFAGGASGYDPYVQITALRAREIDIGITNESGEMLASEFYTRKLAEVPLVSCFELG